MMLLFVILAIGILGLLTVAFVAWWSLRPERPLTLEERQHIASIQAIPVPAEMPTESRPRPRAPHARTEDTAPVLVSPIAAAVAGMTYVTGPILAAQAERDARDYPGLARQWEYETGVWQAKIMREMDRETP